MRRLVSFIVTLSLLVAPFWHLARADSAGTAQSYLATHNTSPWTVLGLVALGANPLPADFLKSVHGTSAIEYEAPILAIAGLGENPRTFGATDYVAAVQSYHTGGQIGDPLMLNDDIFGILAFKASGVPAGDTAVSDAQNFLLAHQNTDGGWGFSITAMSDTNTTASAIVALVAAGEFSNDQHLNKAIAYLRAAQNNDGGFPYDPHSAYGTNSDAASTAWVVWALNALNIAPGSWKKTTSSPLDFLHSTQTTSGYFAFQPGSPEDSFSPVTTAYAAIALAGKALPLLGAAPTASAQFAFRIAGSSSDVCNGTAAGPTALDVVKNASASCNFTYHITATSFGPYLDQINADQAAGATGWIYLVNDAAPSVSAADYTLKTGDRVLWFYGDYSWLPTRLSLSSAQASSGASVMATVESLANGSWQALPDANVAIGANTIATDASGRAALAPPDGYYKVTAGKEGFVRSNVVRLKVGQPSSATVNLSVSVPAGQALGDTTGKTDTVSFAVTPTSLDFGSLAPGARAEKPITIANTGSTAIHVESIASGDDLFTANLSIGTTTWQNYQTDIAPSAVKNETAALAVPAGYSGSGLKTGQITFWAMAQ